MAAEKKLCINDKRFSIQFTSDWHRSALFSWCATHVHRGMRARPTSGATFNGSWSGRSDASIVWPSNRLPIASSLRALEAQINLTIAVALLSFRSDGSRACGLTRTVNNERGKVETRRGPVQRPNGLTREEEKDHEWDDWELCYQKMICVLKNDLEKSFSQVERSDKMRRR